MIKESESVSVRLMIKIQTKRKKSISTFFDREIISDCILYKCVSVNVAFYIIVDRYDVLKKKD